MSIPQLLSRINHWFKLSQGTIPFHQHLVIHYFLNELKKVNPELADEIEQKERMLAALSRHLGELPPISSEEQKQSSLNWALTVAVEENDEELFNAALQAGANVDYRYEGETMLHHAMRLKHVALAEKLILAGADVNAPVSHGRDTLLVLAVLANELPLVKLLIAKGAKINTRSHAYHVTALYAAVVNTNVSLQMLQYLLSIEGVKLNTFFLNKHSYFMTIVSAALSITHQTGNNSKLKAVLASPQLKIHNTSDLISAIDMGSSIPTMQLLLERGYKFDRIAMRQVMRSKNSELFQWAAKECQYSELMKAIVLGDKKKVQSLLETSPALEEKNSLGETAMMLAVEYGHKDISELLFKAHANIDTEDNEGMTPLVRAMQLENYSLASDLVVWGANPKKKNKEGQTILEQAIKAEQASLVKTLLLTKSFTPSPAEIEMGLRSTQAEIKIIFNQLVLDQLKIQLNKEINRLENYGFWSLFNKSKARRISEAMARAQTQLITDDFLNYKEKGKESLKEAISYHRIGFFGKTTTLKNVEASLTTIMDGLK